MNHAKLKCIIRKYPPRIVNKYVCEYKTYYVCVTVACFHRTTTPSFSNQALKGNIEMLAVCVQA